MAGWGSSTASPFPALWHYYFKISTAAASAARRHRHQPDCPGELSVLYIEKYLAYHSQVSKLNSDASNSSPKTPSFIKRLIRGLRMLAMFAVIGVAALLAALWLEHRTEITLPAPTGHFTVGRTTYAWVNDGQTDDLAPSPGAKRKVLVWIWYPSEGSQSVTPADYVPTPWRVALAHTSGVLMSQFLTRDSS